MVKINGKLSGPLLATCGVILILVACTNLSGVQPVVTRPTSPQPAIEATFTSQLATATSQPSAVPTTTYPPATATPLTATATSVPTATAAATATPDTRPSVPIPATISGIVADANGPIANAIVQVKGTPNQTTTDSKGSFTLKGLGGTKLLTLTAWYEGYFVGFTDLNPKNPIWQNGKPVSITLKPLYTTDNNLYGWFTFNGVNGSKSCAICHREYPEWQADAHSQTAKNIRFETIYMGTNVQGQTGQDTKI